MLTRHFVWSLLAAATLLLPRALTAQTLLRWKLQPGDVLTVLAQQQIESQVAFSGKSTVTTIGLQLDLSWKVTAANEREITLEQSVERIRMTLSAPPSAAIEYDSAAKGRLTGQTRDLAASLQPLVGAAIEMRMTTRGEIIAAKPANESAESLLSSEQKATDSGDSSHRAVEQLLRQSLMILPEKEVNAADTWNTTGEFKSAAGPLKQETTYTLAKLDMQDGQQIAQIRTTSKLTTNPPAAASGQSSPPPLNVKLHEHTAKIEFDVSAGRLRSSESAQNLTTERPFRETTIVVNLTSTQKTTIQPKQ
jgi:hypothetical protein